MALVPASYNVRSLFVRRSATILTIFAVAATVAVLAGLLSLRQGFVTLLSSDGREDLAVVLRKGAQSEGESAFDEQSAEIVLKGTPEFAIGDDGQPLASAELYLAVRRFKVDGGETNVPIRGVQPKSFDIHGDDVRIVEGRRLERGADEVMVGRALVDRIRNCRLDDVLVLNTTPFRVVGIFEGRGGYGSEIWGDANRMQEALQRPGYNRIIGVLKPEADVEAMAARMDSDRQTPAKVQDERSYLEGQTGALSGLFLTLGAVLAGFMGLAAAFTGMNSMLAALSARTHEIGILLSVGFQPWAIFLSFMLEAAVLGLLGGIVGCLVVLPLEGLRTGTMNSQTFTEIAFAFRVASPWVLGPAVAFAVFLGVVGGAIPAWRASRLRPTEALRRG